MKKLLSALFAVLISSCCKEPMLTEKINFTGVLPAGIKPIGEPSYLGITINGIVYYDEVYSLSNAFKTVNGIELPVDTNLITSINFYNADGIIMYRGYGYYDLEIRNIINTNNPLTIFKSAFDNETGVVFTIFPVENTNE